MWNFRFRQIGESVWFSFQQFNFFLAIGDRRSVSVNPEVTSYLSSSDYAPPFSGSRDRTRSAPPSLWACCARRTHACWPWGAHAARSTRPRVPARASPSRWRRTDGRSTTSWPANCSRPWRRSWRLRCSYWAAGGRPRTACRRGPWSEDNPGDSGAPTEWRADHGQPAGGIRRGVKTILETPVLLLSGGATTDSLQATSAAEWRPSWRLRCSYWAGGRPQQSEDNPGDSGAPTEWRGDHGQPAGGVHSGVKTILETPVLLLSWRPTTDSLQAASAAEWRRSWRLRCSYWEAGRPRTACRRRPQRSEDDPGDSGAPTERRGDHGQPAGNVRSGVKTILETPVLLLSWGASAAEWRQSWRLRCSYWVAGSLQAASAEWRGRSPWRY